MHRSQSSQKTGFTGAQSINGFTIIEVMIVLVIAAAIILIVFLAVPALQRNSRNNARKSDASRVFSSAQEWRTLNNNTLPHCNDMESRAVGVIPACADGSRTAIESMVGKLGFYANIWSVNRVQYGNEVMYLANSLSNSDVVNYVGDSVLVRSGAACGPNNNLQPGGGLVVLYSQESGDGLTLKCVGS